MRSSTLLLFSILFFNHAIVSQTEFINFFPWTSAATNGVTASDPDIGEFGVKSGCYTATTSVVNSGGAFQTSNPQFFSLFGTTLGLRVGVNWTNISQTITVTIDLRKNGELVDIPVSFNLYDINAAACGAIAANRFIDVVNVVGFKRTNATTVNTAVPFNPNVMSNLGADNIQSGNTITGSPNAGATMSSVVNFTTTICRIVITYSSGSGTPPTCAVAAPWPLAVGNDPRAQEIFISPLTIGVTGCALPVTFGDMYSICEGDKRTLNWVTYTELSNDFFDVYHSADGLNFDFLKRIVGAGSTQLKQEYSIILPWRSEQMSYYKIVQQDFDGQRKELKMIPVKGDCGENELVCFIYPNPVTENCVLNFADATEAPIQLIVYNMLGEKVKEEVILPKKDQRSFFIETAFLKTGMYVIELVQLETRNSLKFIKN